MANPYILTQKNPQANDSITAIRSEKIKAVAVSAELVRRYFVLYHISKSGRVIYI